MHNNSNISETNDSFHKLFEILNSVKFVSCDYADKELNREVYLWYLSRFRLCKEDKVLININGYLKKLQLEDCNDYTKQKINMCALDIIRGGNGYEI